MIHEKNEKVSVNIILMSAGGFFALLSGGMFGMVKLQQLMLSKFSGTEEVPDLFGVMHAVILEHMPRLFVLAVVLAAASVIRHLLRKEKIARDIGIGVTGVVSVLIAVWTVLYVADTRVFIEFFMQTVSTNVPKVFEIYIQLLTILAPLFIYVIFLSPIIFHFIYFIEGLFFSGQQAEENTAP